MIRDPTISNPNSSTSSSLSASGHKPTTTGFSCNAASVKAPSFSLRPSFSSILTKTASEAALFVLGPRTKDPMVQYSSAFASNSVVKVSKANSSVGASETSLLLLASSLLAAPGSKVNREELLGRVYRFCRALSTD